MGRTRIFPNSVIVGVTAALLLMGIEVERRPGSLESYGRRLLVIDVAILLLYGIAGIWTWRQQNAELTLAVNSGMWIGLTAGAVLAANHINELFLAHRPFALVIAPVLLMFALFAAAGSIAWEHTRSLVLAVIAGVWCAMVAVLVLLCVVFCFNLVFENRAIAGLHEAFIMSVTRDPGTFVVVNSLEAASEFLVRLPILALLLSLTGALMTVWTMRRTRKAMILVALFAPIMCTMGVAVLWHADTLERAARPPYVMTGVLLDAIALCSVYPLWSALQRSQR